MNPAVKRTLDVLCAYYSDREGQPRKLNAVQASVYETGLSRFSPERLESAARIWMQRSKFFPAVSELLEILDPPADKTALAHAAWGVVESAIRKGGIYSGAKFAQGAIGEAVRLVFGSWYRACGFEYDSPGWAIRRQSFLQIFPSLIDRDLGPVTLKGLHPHAEPYDVPLLAGLPEPRLLEDGSDPIGHREASVLVAEIESRYKALKGHKPDPESASKAAR